MKYLKTTFLKIITISVLTFFSSCNIDISNKTAKVKAERVDISGDLVEYIQVVQNEYEVVDVQKLYGRLSIKIKALQSLPLDKIEENDFELSASLLADKGIPISGVNEFKINYNSKEKLKSLLKFGSGEEIISLETYLGGYDEEKYASIVKTFTVFSKIKKKEVNSTTSKNHHIDKSINLNTKSNVVDNKTTVNLKESDIENDWDEMLDNYEEFINEYIKFYNKAMKGDASAISKYITLMEKALSLQESMLNAQNNNELSIKQVQRMIDIQLIMTNGILEL
jgi:hypothetical protein